MIINQKDSNDSATESRFFSQKIDQNEAQDIQFSEVPIGDKSSAAQIKEE